MAYVDKVLLPDERVLCITTIHGIVYTEGFLFTICGGLLTAYGSSIIQAIFGQALGQSLSHAVMLVSLLTITVGILLLIGAYVRQVSTELAVTNRRVIAKYGLVARTTYEIMVDRITGANFEQTFFGRLVGYGTVIVHGAGGDISPFEKIGNPEGFHKALMQVLERGQVMVKR